MQFRQFLSRLRDAGEVVDIYREVDPDLELAEIHRRVIEEDGPVLFFHNVKGSSFPVVTNLFGSDKRIELAFPSHPEKILENLIKLYRDGFQIKTLWKNRFLVKKIFNLGSKNYTGSAVLDCQISPPDLTRLPFIKSWPLDGGFFITLPLVYTKSPDGSSENLGMYRIQRFSSSECGLHFQIQKGGGFHYSEAERNNLSLPVAIFLGASPALIISAVAPLPENFSEIFFGSFLQDCKIRIEKIKRFSYPILSDCEFALLGHSPSHERRAEGPFGDHYGYYSLKHDFPIFKCDKIFHRKGAIFPATVVGKPKQEDFYIGNFIQKLIKPLIPLMMPGVVDLWSYGECGFHTLTAAIVRERYERESIMSAMRILGEGQLALTKFLLITDQNLDLKNFKSVLVKILERFVPEKDFFILPNLALDTLDYTGTKLNSGSHAIMVGVGEKRRSLPEKFSGTIPGYIKKVTAYVPGCLVIEGEFKEELLEWKEFSSWPLLLFVDDVEKSLESDTTFLWTVFTRFDPAKDIYVKGKFCQNHIIYSGPLLIDARMKDSYPQVVECDHTTKKKVSQNWNSYFLDRSRLKTLLQIF